MQLHASRSTYEIAQWWPVLRLFVGFVFEPLCFLLLLAIILQQQPSFANCLEALNLICDVL
jgi:hypothetical protein